MLKLFSSFLRVTCVIFARAINTDFWQTILARATESRKKTVVSHLFKVLANEDALLPTQMFPRLPVRATFVSDTNFVSGTQKMFLILVRNILCPQQMFPSLHNMETMLPRFQYFPGLLVYLEHAQNSLLVRQNGGKYSTPLSTQPLQEVQNVTRRVRHERSWKNEEIETLIGLYKERVCLWDFGSEEYINRDGKDLAYEQRDEELKKYNISGEEYKSKSSAAIFVA